VVVRPGRTSGRGARDEEVTGFSRNDYPLRKFRHDVWKGFVFVNFDGHAEPLATQMAGLDRLVDPYDLENYQTVEQTDWGVCDWDWKIMVDNFMECYHHMGPTASRWNRSSRRP